MPNRVAGLGIRTKLILLFVLIKLVPLMLLAVLAWQGVTQLAERLSDRSAETQTTAKDTLVSMSDIVTKESTRALDLKSRESLERLTTDTALAVADFLHDRDDDARLAATLEPTEAVYRQFLQNRQRQLIDSGAWQLAADGKSWVQANPNSAEAVIVTPENPENKQDFNYRPPQTVGKFNLRPLYHEMTFVGLDGRELVKVSTGDLLSKELRNVSHRENTYAKAENYFPALHALKPGELYVSDVIGPYVRSHYYSPVTPEAAAKLNIPFEPEREAYSGKENPVGKRFQGIVRWATPVTRQGKVIGYVTLALNHDHVMSFTDHIMPTNARYTPISDASNGNYAFMWDYRDRSIAHPRHQSIIGVNPESGDYETPWLDAEIYKAWQESGQPLTDFLAGVPIFDQQRRDKKPSAELIKAGIRGLDCRYLNFAPQCHGWYDLTKLGGSGSFVILWSGVWKLTTAATIPYYTGPYGKTPRGFGFVTIGANVDEFHKSATETKVLLDERIKVFQNNMKAAAAETAEMIQASLQESSWKLSVTTFVMVVLVVLIAIWLAGLLTNQVTRLTDGLRRIEQGDLGFRLAKSSNDELGSLADSINRMADGVLQSFQRLDEAKTRAEEANRMKTSFLASISHELRTPLNGILGFAELLKLDLKDPEQQTFADTILTSGQHLLAIVNDLLDLAKAEAGRLELRATEVDVKRLCGDVAANHREHARRKGLVLDEIYADDLPAEFHCDPTRLRQILNNLLNNAVKFTNAGSVTLMVETIGASLRFGVKDTGIGIAENQQSLVFEKFRQLENFVTRTHGGSGLGLSLATELAELMGGEITLASKLGEGSTFYLTLPPLSEDRSNGDGA